MVSKCFYGENADVFPGVIARSIGAHNYEKFIHSTIYPYTIHPHSKFRLYWEIVILSLIICQILVYVPLWLFVNHASISYQLVLHIVLFLRTTDVALSFFTGYVENGTEIVVLDQKRIIRRYLATYFIIDVLACIPLETIVCIYHGSWDIIAITPWHMKNAWNFVMFAPVIQMYLRMSPCVNYFKNISKMLFWTPFVTSLIFILSAYVFIMNFELFVSVLYCFTHHVKVPEVTWSNFGIFASALLNLPISFLYENTVFVGWISLIRFPAIILGYFCTVYLNAYFVKFMRYTMTTTERFRTLESNVRIFTRKNRLPVSLKKKTLLYFKVFINSKYYKEDEMFNYFPETFKSEVFSQLALSILQGFYAFEGLPIYVLRRLAEKLRYQLYLPNEVVMMKNEPTLNLYFVQTGTVALYSSDDTELYHFDDGCSFNGRHFLDGKPARHHYAISIEVSEIFILRHDIFLEIMSSYPKLLERMKEKFFKTILHEEI